MDKITMGDRIRDVRKKRDLTQEQLAEKLDITISYVSEIERGLKLPSFPLFLKDAIVNPLLFQKMYPVYWGRIAHWPTSKSPNRRFRSS